MKQVYKILITTVIEKKVLKKYASLKKPNWKRVGYKYEEPGEFKPFNSTVIKKC